MEHLPWIGSNYNYCPLGQKYLIVGFSHWGRYNDEQLDSEKFTRRVVEEWALKGEIAFFNAIPRYFGEDNIEAFWQRVAFANTLPTTVGDEDERYGNGTPEQRAEAEPRALRLIEQLRPDKIFVFSKKAWKIWPGYTGSIKNQTLKAEGYGEIDFGTYAHPDGEASAYGLRHPQFAPKVEMTAAIRAALMHKP